MQDSGLRMRGICMTESCYCRRLGQGAVRADGCFALIVKVDFLSQNSGELRQAMAEQPGKNRLFLWLPGAKGASYCEIVA
jgi:hypothetical protein